MWRVALQCNLNSGGVLYVDPKFIRCVRMYALYRCAYIESGRFSGFAYIESGRFRVILQHNMDESRMFASKPRNTHAANPNILFISVTAFDLLRT